MTKMTNTKNTITIKTMADLFKLFTVKGTAGVDGYELPEFWRESVDTSFLKLGLAISFAPCIIKYVVK